MDNYTESTPPKKPCISKNVDDVQLKECVLQQLPSTMKQTDSTANLEFKNQETVRFFTPKLTNLESQIVSSKEYQVSNKSHKLETCANKLQKLRILSSKGRDLGEFQVQLTNNSLKEKTVKLIKSVKKMPIISLSNKELNQSRTFKQNTANISQINLIPYVDSTSCDKTVYGINKTNKATQQENWIIPQKIEMFTNDATGTDKTKQLYNSNIRYSEIDKASTNETNSMYRINNNEHDHSEINNIKNNSKIQEVTKNNKVSTKAAKVPSDIEISKSQSLIGSYKKCVINSSNEQYRHFKTGKNQCITIIRKTKDGKIIASLKTAPKIDKYLNRDNLYNNKNKSVSSDKNNLLQVRSELGSINNQVHEIKTQKNVMTIIPNSEKLFNQNAVLPQKYDVAISSASTKYIIKGDNKIAQDTNSDNMQSKDVSKKEFENTCLNVAIDNSTSNSEIHQIINNTNMQSNLQDKTSKTHHKDLSNQYDIIQRAMDSIKDNELRELALQALKDCGIGIQRYIPIHSPEEYKSVCDTQVQTEVFGLLDSKSFILINKDIDNINRISQISLQDIADGQNLLSANNLCSYVDSIPKIPDVCEQQNTVTLHNFFKHFEENLDVVKIKDTLSTTMKKYRNLIDHLQKDFESVKQYDQNGMLNIHNAVISNNIYLVQRQLMILKYCKESVDILTEDEVTSLELAIKYDICSEIVKLLLEAGALPVIPKYIHESALIIASKQSSPLLPMLIKYIADIKLLDLKDSEGLAALHYCSMHGNLEGVNALLSAGANKDLKDGKSGRTPLFHAMENNHTWVAQTLLKAGAIGNIANYAGQTTLPIITDKKSEPFRILTYTNTKSF